jgi:hypothetical protein
MADSLSRNVEGHEVTDLEEGLLATIQGLPLVYALQEDDKRKTPCVRAC